MGTKYFGKDISPACRYCEHGKNTRDGRMVLCGRIGIVYKDYACKKFVYAPLKRIPKRQPEMSLPDNEEFQL